MPEDPRNACGQRASARRLKLMNASSMPNPAWKDSKDVLLFDAEGNKLAGPISIDAANELLDRLPVVNRSWTSKKPCLPEDAWVTPTPVVPYEQRRHSMPELSHMTNGEVEELLRKFDPSKPHQTNSGGAK